MALKVTCQSCPVFVFDFGLKGYILSFSLEIQIFHVGLDLIGQDILAVTGHSLVHQDIITFHCHVPADDSLSTGSVAAVDRFPLVNRPYLLTVLAVVAVNRLAE